MGIFFVAVCFLAGLVEWIKKNRIPGRGRDENSENLRVSIVSWSKRHVVRLVSF